MEVIGGPGGKEGRSPIEAQSIGQAIRSISGPLIRQVRRFQTLALCREALSPRLLEHCAPFDVRMAPGPNDEPVCTVYWYIASPTAQVALENHKQQMLAVVNDRSPQLVEEFRYELAGPEKIRQQLNILNAGPD